MGDDDIIRGMNEDARKKREEDRLKTLLGGALKSKGQKAVQRIDISGIVELLTTRAEFNGFRESIKLALTKIESLLEGVDRKVADARETSDVLGRLLATLARKGLVTQEDIIATSKAIEEGQAAVAKIHEVHGDAPLEVRLGIMRADGVDDLAIEEYEHLARKRSANRIVAIHRELKSTVPPKKGDPPLMPKTFAQIVEVIRAEGHPEEQVREYLRAFFPWADGRKGPDSSDDWFCPECDAGFGSQDCDDPDAVPPVEGLADDLVACPKCGRGLFDASEFVRPPEFGGEKDEAKEPEDSETPEEEEAEKVEFVEDRGLACPEGVESGEGFYDPASTGPEDDGFPLCAGCGTKRSEHKRTLRVVKTVGTDDHSEEENSGSE
jgi:hypothetical protein